MNKQNPKYSVILHQVRKDLNLSCNEYCVADMIYHLSNNPESRFPSWCYAGKETLAEFLGLSKTTIHKIINTLIKNALIIRDQDTKYLRSTSKWYGAVIIAKDRIKGNGKETALPEKSLYLEQVRKPTSGSTETVRNNNSNTNIEKADGVEKLKEEIGNQVKKYGKKKA